ncbi:chromate transporter [Rudaeicoccus suwonensis]|uniref:Chromate transporter n=1 Tax=Rudaeicoccus suwonensis TaxID=657409 RepID=A0A561E465_9MICO|nr:chromate transporter [Rudaeicoccus suwonensis]TWE10370.1 chromate transporter [Rudaeicoccus suwonensis]
MRELIWLVLAFGELSVLSFGGGNAVLPQMHTLVVHQFHWVTNAQFSQMFALSQAAPGPNLMIVPLIGWHVAGVAGVVAVSIGKFVPSSTLAYFVAGRWDRFADRPWRKRLQTAIVPVSAGLVAGGAAVIIQTTDIRWLLLVMSGAVAGLSFVRRLHPLVLLAGCAIAGMALSTTGLIPTH